ncbi:MAG: TerC/Alx family metal homeostasis membrane protein [Methanomassiliicoccaceae archaeon]|jgi:tellurite resistance protein TerC|nr:TerC/Alx family metal homeostasis membrane protein [Methanomassiliicoccaceae archaeon]
MIDEDVLWIIFIILVAGLLILDLGIINRKKEDVSFRKACALSVFWISVGLAFGVLICLVYGMGHAYEYYAAYAIEEMMSIDNLFVFIIIFSYFQVPKEYQHKALFYGILGAMLFRGLFIMAGIRLLDEFDFMLYIFGIILIITAIRTVMKRDMGENAMNRNIFVRMCRRFMKVSDEYDGDRFFTVRNGIKMATPLLVVVIVLELSDIIFALDSVPAVLAISKVPIIVYSSNIFAVLGLRSLYFALRGAISSLAYLKYGLGVILAFVGVKLILDDVLEIPVLVSLAVILLVLTVTVLLSIMLTKRKGNEKPV